MPQLWTNTGQGFMASDILSDKWRTSLQPLTRFRQFCDVEEAIGKNAGEVFNWTVYGDTAAAADDRVLDETLAMPATTFPLHQGTVTMTEHGISIEHSLKYEAMSEHNVPEVISKTLKNDANRAFDYMAEAQFAATPLTVVGTDASTTVYEDTGTLAAVNNSPLNLVHVKNIRDTMEERNIPTFDGEDYMSVSRPTTLRPLVDALEQIHQYTDEGWKRLVKGERGRYEGIRFVTQTNVADDGAFATNSASGTAYFFGADTVTEAIAIPEELRGKIPDDYGRSKGIAWYYIGAFALTHGNVTTAESRKQLRVMKWTSA